MRILNRSLGLIDLAFLEMLAANRTVESLTHDYKGALPTPGNQKQKEQFLETVASFANTEGGVIVFGFRESSWQVHGLERLDLDGDVRRLETLALELDPPVRGLIVGPEVIQRDDRRVLLLGVPRSLMAPHAVIYDDAGRTGYFRRNNRGKAPMDSRTLGESFGEADRWRRDVEQFRQERLAFGESQIAAIGEPDEWGVLYVHVLPLGRLHDRHDVGELRDDATGLFRHVVGSSDRRMNVDGLLILDRNADGLASLQCFRNGGTEFRLELKRELTGRAPAVVDGRRTLFLIASTIRSSVSWLASLGVSPPFAICVSLDHVEGLRFSVYPGQALPFDRRRVAIPAVYVGPADGETESAVKEVQTLVCQATGHFKNPIG